MEVAKRFVLAGEGLPTIYISGDNSSRELVEEITAKVLTLTNEAGLHAPAPRGVQGGRHRPQTCGIEPGASAELNFLANGAGHVTN